jgi:hypothetical protein
VTLLLQSLVHYEVMNPYSRSPLFAQAICLRVLGYWNWKCALLSATARSLVYLAALTRTGLRGGLSIVLVEVAYVTVTAGLYAGLQQKALGLRSQLLGNVVLGVPGLAQVPDWLTHCAAGAKTPTKATLAVCIFARISALFHLHVMRRGVFLTGRRGQSLLEDFRRMPRLIAGFVHKPILALSAMAAWLARSVESEAAL